MKHFAQVLPPGERIDLEALIEMVSSNACGAIVTFSGTVRDTEEGRALAALSYEHHEQMTLPEIEKILAEALGQFDILRSACVHRTGEVPVGEASVVVVVSAGHRGAAFDACEFIMDKLKQSVPIWKSPVYVDKNGGVT